MPEEQVKVKISVEGADEGAAAVQKLTQAHEEHGRQVENAGESHTHFAHKVRGAAHIVTGTVGQMAGTINPELGRMVGALGMGAHMFRYFGAQVAIAVTVLELISAAIEMYIKKQKEAEAFQLKLNKAVREGDYEAARGELAKVNDELAKFTYRGEIMAAQYKKMGTEIGAFWSAPITAISLMMTSEKELNEQRKQATETAARLFKESGEARKLELDVAKEQVKLDTEVAKLDMDRAGNIQQIVGAMGKQQDAGRRQIAIEHELFEIEEMRRIKKLIAEGSTEEGVARMKALNEKRAVFAQEAATKEVADRRAVEQRILKEQMDAGNESLRVQKTYTDARLSMIKAAEEEELSAVEEFSSTEEELARGTERAKEEAVTQGARARISKIQDEISYWKQLAASYPEDVKVQREAQAKLLELSNQRVSVEQEANSKIIGERKQMVEKLKAIEAEKAAVGGSLEQKAFADLRKAGYTQITSEMVKSQADNRKKWGEYFSMQYDVMGASLSPEQFEYMQETADMEKRRRKADVSTFGAISMAGQSRRASFGMGVAPEEMVSSYTGGTEFGNQMADSFKKVEGEVKKSLENIRSMLAGEEVGGHNLANVITDMVIRKMEFEAARAA